MESEPGAGSGPVRRGLQDMSKDELVQKCKGLLAIAQKAKSAKDGKWTFLILE